ncbi:MAG: sulfatase-like hydrolase/transferase, partial [Planctomycetes bacterium]|nr:sulfatase-like hydrolase/transferase [Planctomycetota bacterium]
MNTAKTLLTTLLVCFCTFSACNSSSDDKTGKPNVFIYLVDTLRPDHLSLYGYSRATCPNLEIFARDSVIFDEAYTPATWTRPATASLLTGLLPYKHGAVTLSNKLPEDIVMISETLQTLDYETSSFVANVNVIEVWGFNQGYGHFDDVKERTGSNDAEDVVNASLEYLSVDRDKPVFMFIHTVDPHSPYKAPNPYCNHFNPGKKWRALLPKDLTENTPAGILAGTKD